MLVHKAAEELGLPHGSRGEGDARQVTVKRPAPTPAPKPAAPKAQPPPPADIYVGPPKGAAGGKSASKAEKESKGATKAAAQSSQAQAEKPTAPKPSVAQLPIEEIAEEGDEDDDGEDKVRRRYSVCLCQHSVHRHPFCTFEYAHSRFVSPQRRRARARQRRRKRRRNRLLRPSYPKPRRTSTHCLTATKRAHSLARTPRRHTTRIY